MPLTPRFALLPVLLIALAGAPSPVPVAVAAPTSAGLIPIVMQLTPETVSTTGVTAVADGFRVPPSGGAATLRVHAAQPMTNLVVVGRLTGRLLPRFSIASGNEWQPLDIAEPAGRIPASDIATELYTLPPNETDATLRITFPASRAGGQFTKLSIYGEDDVPTGGLVAAGPKPKAGRGRSYARKDYGASHHRYDSPDIPSSLGQP